MSSHFLRSKPRQKYNPLAGLVAKVAESVQTQLSERLVQSLAIGLYSQGQPKSRWKAEGEITCQN